MTPRIKANTRKFEVFLPEDAYGKIKQEADKNGLSVSGFVRMILLRYLETK